MAARTAEKNQVIDSLRSNSAPPGLSVRGMVNLKAQDKIVCLPARFSADILDLTKCIRLVDVPADLKVSRLILSGCDSLQSLPAGLSVNELVWHGCPIKRFPKGVEVKFRLDLADSPALDELPAGLRVGSLNLRNCTGLTSLPEGLDVSFLVLNGCTSLAQWPVKASVSIGQLSARNCVGLTHLPSWLKTVDQLDLAGCIGIDEIPEGLQIGSWIDIAGTGITRLPASCSDAYLRWRGVQVDERIVFRPETITAEEVLGERNVELRRVKLERLGYEKFFAETKAEIIHKDTDKGGVRQLLRVNMQGDEALVCVTFSCPSTARQYVIRVPPTMTSCHQAVAWIAGCDNPNDYKLEAES